MSKNGFSLVEMVIIISILGVLFAVTLTTFTNFSARLSLVASAKSLAAELRALQSQAITRHETLTLDLAKLNLPRNIKLTKFHNIRFSASGFPPPGGSGTLILENKFGGRKKIIVSSAGRVRLE